MKALKYSVFVIGAIFLILFLYNTIMAENCFKKCDKDPKCWEESYCHIGF